MSVMSPPRCSCGTPMVHEYPSGRPKCPHCDNVCPTPADQCSTCRALSRADLHNVASKLPKWQGPLPNKDWDT